MPKLSEIQTILLSTASQRPEGNLLPAPESIGRAGSRIHKGLSALLKRGLAAENPVSLPDRAWREEGDRHIGLVLTASGRKAIGLEPHAPGDIDAEGEDGQSIDKLQAPTNKRETGSIADHTAKMPGTVRADSKQAKIVELLRRQSGATLAELTEATGWLPHTTRAALTGLRKKGHNIEKGQRGEVTCYSITEAR